MQEYIKTILVNLLVLFICGNILIALTPKWVKNSIRLLFRVTYKTTKFTYTQTRSLLKFSYRNLSAFYKWAEKRTTTTTKPQQLKKVVNGSSNVIPFPKRK